MSEVSRDLRAIAREWLLTLAALIGMVCLLSVLAGAVFQVKPLIFRSGSMAPAIPTGSLAISHEVPATAVQPGDVVSVTASSGNRITHRVVRTVPEAGVVGLTLQGDANDFPDAETYRVTKVDRVVVHVPLLGYLVSWLRHPITIFVGGAIVGALAVSAFGRRRPPGPGDRQDSQVRKTYLGLDDSGADCAQPTTSGVDLADFRRRLLPTHHFGLSLGAAAVAVTLVATALTARGTAAAFADTGTAGSGSFATKTQVLAPTLTCGLLGILSVRFNWTAVAGATGYDFVRTVDGGSTTTTQYGSGVTSATVNSSLAETGSVVVRARVDYGSTTWYSADSNRRSYTLVLLVAGTCV